VRFGSGLRGVEFVPVAGEGFEVVGVVALGGFVALGSVALADGESESYSRASI
jgi:hypothetical protein